MMRKSATAESEKSLERGAKVCDESQGRDDEDEEEEESDAPSIGTSTVNDMVRE